MESNLTPIEFIKNFQNEGTIETFTEGCCYWFAMILFWRFNNLGATIVYNEITGHFATLIRGKIYDITGEIKDNDKWIEWSEYAITEPVYAKTIIRDCILKDPDWII